LIAAENLCARQYRDGSRHGTTRDFLEVDTSRAGQLRKLGQSLAINLLAGNVDINTFYRNAQQLGVVNFNRDFIGCECLACTRCRGQLGSFTNDSR
jgi:hypothetical protein